MRLATVWLTVALSLGSLLMPLSLDAQQPAKIARIGWLSLSASPVPAMLEAFRQGLRELGYIEGQNVAIEYRLAGGKHELLPSLAADLVRLQMDVIVASATPAALAAKGATTTIPIVMVAVGNPVDTGLVASLARPGGNVTGLATLIPELSATRVELLKETFPHVSHVAVLYNPANPAKGLDWQETRAAAQALGVRLHAVEVRGPDEFEHAFAAIVRGGAEALITLADPVTFTHRQRIVDFAAASRLPAMYGQSEVVEAGGLMAYGVHFPDLYRRAAVFVDKILRGARPVDLPVEQPMRFEFVVNLKTANALGLRIPQSILFRADRVIQGAGRGREGPE